MKSIKIISVMSALIISSCLSLSAFAAQYYVQTGGGTKSIAGISTKSGKKLAGLELRPGQTIEIKCLGSVRQACNIGQFIIKSDYKSTSECQKATAKTNPNCAKFDNNWHIARIYSDHGNNGVLVGPLRIKGEYIYRFKNLSNRKLYFTLKNSFNG